MFGWISLSQGRDQKWGEGLNVFFLSFFCPFIIFPQIIPSCFLVFLILSHFPCPVSPSPQWEPMVMYGSIKESYAWWMEWPLGLSLSFSSLSYNFLPLSVSLPLYFLLSPSFPPLLTPLGVSEWRMGVMCFKLKLTHLLCPWPNQVIDLP